MGSWSFWEDEDPDLYPWDILRDDRRQLCAVMALSSSAKPWIEAETILFQENKRLPWPQYLTPYVSKLQKSVQRSYTETVVLILNAMGNPQ